MSTLVWNTSFIAVLIPVLIQSHLVYQIIAAFQPAYVGHRLLVECQGKKLLKCELFAFPQNEFQKYKLAKYSPGVPSNGG